MVYYFIGGSVPPGTGRLPCPTQGIPKSTGVSSLSLWNGITWYNFGGIPYIYICVCTVYTHVYTPASNTPKSYSYIPIISAIISYILIISIISQWNHEKSMKIRPHQCFRILWKEKPPLHLFNFLIELPASSTQVPWLLITFPAKRNIQQTLLGDFQGMPQASVPLKRMLFWEATCCSKGLDVISFKSPWYQYMNPSKGLVANFSFASS